MAIADLNHVPPTFIGSQSFGIERDPCAVVLNRDYQRPKSKYNANLATEQSCDMTMAEPIPIQLSARGQISHFVEHIQHLHGHVATRLTPVRPMEQDDWLATGVLIMTFVGCVAWGMW